MGSTLYPCAWKGPTVSPTTGLMQAYCSGSESEPGSIVMFFSFNSSWNSKYALTSTLISALWRRVFSDWTDVCDTCDDTTGDNEIEMIE